MTRSSGTIVVLLCVLLFGSSLSVFSQNQQPVSDPQAIALAQQSMAALTNGTAVTDVTLNGNATRIAGSDTETGSATLQAKGTGESRIDLNLSKSTRTEIRNDTGNYPQGASVVNGGNQQAWPLHNCWINASWFFPGFSVLAETADPAQVFSYVGQETRNGVSVHHLKTYRYTPAKRPEVPALNRTLSAMDIYLDTTSLLPLAFVFNTHPDDDSATNITIEVDFSNYQPVVGILVPLHIQKLIWNGLALDVMVTSAVFNTGVPDSQFAIAQGQ
jgi:hypothetical protein